MFPNFHLIQLCLDDLLCQTAFNGKGLSHREIDHIHTVPGRAKFIPYSKHAVYTTSIKYFLRTVTIIEYFNFSRKSQTKSWIPYSNKDITNNKQQLYTGSGNVQIVIHRHRFVWELRTTAVSCSTSPRTVYCCDDCAHATVPTHLQARNHLCYHIVPRLL